MKRPDLNGAELHKLSKSDLGFLLAWRNHPDVSKYMYSQHEVTLEEHLAWFEKVSTSSLHHQFILKINNLPCGYMAFFEDKELNVANWGFYVAPNASKGVGLILGSLGISMGFEVLQFKAILGEVIEGNEVSKRFHERLGFRAIVTDEMVQMGDRTLPITRYLLSNKNMGM